VRIELIEPFEFTFASEPPIMFVRITNTGTEPMAIGLGDESDLQLENDPALASDSSELAPWTRRFSYVRNQPKPEGGISVQPGESLVLGELDYCDMDFCMHHWEFQRIRPHLRVKTGIWIAGAWQERKIEDAPNLTSAKSLYDFKLGPDGQQRSVIALPMAGETWLVGCRLPSSFKTLPQATGNIDFRICRLPDGKMPASIAHDVDARRLTIHFDGGEEDVVINTRTGMPVSGSEQRVPHLHFWMKLSGRPFRDIFQEKKDGKVPTMVVAAPKMPESPPAEISSTSPTASQAPAPKQPTATGIWILIGTALVLALAAFMALRSRRGRQGNG
jgi:hypothetical protein